jgi:NAD(P)-dependent dehydrogenase (short-subunit alcohol dehydrogenase family)
MGSAAALQLAEQGWSLVLCDLHRDHLEPTAARVRDLGCEAELLAGDIADAEFPNALSALLGSQPVGALIHTAGLSPTMADGPRIFAVNYDATARLVETVCPRMAEGSCAVLISSCSAHMVRSPEFDAAIEALVVKQDRSACERIATTPQAAYPLSKRAVIRLVAHAAPSFGARKARIVSISPGLIDTPMGRAEQAASPQMAQMLAMTPLGRYGVAEEIASVAVFLCSPAASFITGCDIRVDGGVLAAMGF